MSTGIYEVENYYTNDDYTAIVNAISAASQHSGGIILLANKDIAVSITVPSNIIIKGLGAASII